MWARERGDDWDEDVGVGVGVGVGVPTTGWRADRWFMCVASGGCVVVLCCGCETVTVTKERGGNKGEGRGGEGRKVKRGQAEARESGETKWKRFGNAASKQAADRVARAARGGAVSYVRLVGGSGGMWTAAAV